MLRLKKKGERYRRMQLKVKVIVLKQGELWDSEVLDISATGLLIQRPTEWDGELGEEMSVELILADRDTIALFATVVRYDAELLGLEFSHIPPSSEVPLWTLLGEYADAMDEQ